MGVYDFNTTAYDINEIIRQLKHELQSIVVNSQSNITEIKQKISADEALLDRLKKEVDELPDFTEQYNELRIELDKLKVVLDEISKHPIILDNIDVSDSGKLYTEVQKINHQLIYANHAVHDASGRNIIDTYATKDEIADIASSLSNKKDRQAELTFDGSATKTVKKITQNVNGELDVEFIDIAGGGGGSQIEIASSDNSITVSNETTGSAEKYELSVNTDVVATKESVDNVKDDLNNLTDTVDNHTAQIEQIQEDIDGIDSSLTDKKDRQPELTFDGSSIKTVKKITQNANGELDVEFEDIDYPDYSISSPDGSINVSTSEGVTDLTLPDDVVRDSNYVHVEGATEAPLTDGIASVGISAKYAREDHVHPTDTSREDIANKTTVVLGTSDSKYPTDKAVADFVKSSISESVDQTYSSTSTKAQSGVAVNEAFKTRETSILDNSYTYLGMSNIGAETEKLYWKLVSFKPKTNYWTLQFEIDVCNGRKGERSFDSEIYETKRLTIYSAYKDSVEKAVELRYKSQSESDSRGYGNNIYYEMDSSKTVTIYIYAKRTANSSQICRLASLRNFQGISNITWHEPVNDVGTQPTNPVKFKEVFPAIASTTSNIGSDSVPVYINKGKPVSCNSSNLKAGKDDDGNVIKNTYQKKLTFDTTPTAGSTNPVTSGGIKTAIDTVDAKGIVINEINGENVICFE